MTSHLSTATPKAARQWIPFFVLGVSLLLTAAATYYVVVTAHARDGIRFQSHVQRTQAGIQTRMETYIALLHATSGLFAANGEVGREQFHNFVSPIDIRSRYPGLQGIGFSRRVAADQVDALEASVRAEGLPRFEVWPESPAADRNAIVYLEPLDRRNRVAMGFDMTTDPVRRAAMERARDTGMPVATGKILLVQEIDDRKQPGFLIFLPVYRQGTPVATVAQRRAALEGFVFSPFRTADLLEGIFGTGASPPISFAIYSGRTPRPDALLFHSAPGEQGDDGPTFRATRLLDFAGAPWTISYATLPVFDATSGKNHAALLLVLGLFASGVLFAIAQSQVEAREEAEAASQAKDHFLAALSHELRTPLTPVLAVLSGMESDDRLPADVVSNLAMVRRNVELEARLIDDLLDITRITQGKLELLPRTADLEQILEHAIETCSGQVPPASRPRIVTDLAPLDHRLVADAPRLTQVFWNLLSNAIKFTPADGTVRVRTSQDAERQQLVVEVSDTGMGIDPERLPHIFDAFFQAGRSIARQFGGLGLGLAISKTIVELHGGTLTAVSEGPGKGATFTVRLPIGDILDQTASLLTPLGKTRLEPPLTAGAAGAAETAAAGTGRPLHILLVEDHADTADAMATLLRAAGRSVTVAGSVAAALEAAEAACGTGSPDGHGPIDLVVSDVGLPDGTGLELMSELSRRYGLQGIALSGFGMDDDLRKSQEAGFAQHLTKPVTLQTLETAIAQVTATASAPRL
ncbi:MAG TPA: CHASE domain-containing protein [Thermoanaerobaculia bacterium]|nr:CHASE domain-containing protein [Thermoanaerobaculia bacterium]